jgi:MbtH protein
MSDAMDDREHVVVRNAEEQYSIWPADREPPSGWETVGRAGTRQECLDYIGEVWTDMRPKSVREQLSASTG